MIHKYFLNGFYIVLDICSGAVHIIDELTFKLLDYTDENMDEICPVDAFNGLSSAYTYEEINEAYEELFELYTSGLLYSKDDYKQFLGKIVPSPIKAMCLNIAHDCNLRCEYCFAAKGDFGTGRELMSAEMGKAAIDFLINNSGNRRNLEVDFFGGEPLMNFKVVKEIVDYARSFETANNKKFRFTLTTNGLLLNDEISEYINQEMDNIVLSIDGRKAINDTLRVTPNGKGCYDNIVPKYQALVEKRGTKNYYVRGTFTRHNYDFTEDVLHLYDLGFKEISIEPVVSDVNLPYAITEEDIEKASKEYEKLAKTLIEMKKAGKRINFFHFMMDLDQGPCAIKRLRGCSCGNEYVAVTPNGDIYPCHQFVGKADYIMGNLLDGSFDHEMKKLFTTANVFNKSECSDCWARFYCSGGCNANNLEYRGDMFKPHKLSCELEKKRIECAIMIKANLAI